MSLLIAILFIVLKPPECPGMPPCNGTLVCSSEPNCDCTCVEE